MTSRTSPTISGSSAEVGSSKSMMSGFMARARAMATRCCWPPESELGMASAFSERPTRASRRSAVAEASSLLMSLSSTGAYMTFSRTL